MESKHKVIRDILLRLKADDEQFGEQLLAQESNRISNELYGNNFCFSHELAKGFTRPVENGSFPNLVPEEIIKARETIMAKLKVNLILRSKSIAETPVNASDLIQVFIKLQHENRGKWSCAKPVLSYE